jgi:hypothetical protein
MTGSAKKIRKPKPWKHPQPITKSQLLQMREEFWDTSPHYGGRKGTFSGMSYHLWLFTRIFIEINLGLSNILIFIMIEFILGMRRRY